MDKYLLSIEIIGEKIWNRSILVQYLPEEDDVNFYYKQLCGFSDATINISYEVVPEEFNEALLMNMNDAPFQFPVSDLETLPGECEKREQFKQYVKQLCEMERTRAKLQVFVNEVKIQEEEEEEESEKRARSSQKAWVRDILRSLNEDQDYEDAIEVRNETHESVVPLAWILTPTVEKTRLELGSRFITDPILGKKWDSLVGTDVFPDFVISRRISTANWAFQHEASVKFLSSMLEWYIISQDSSVVGGISNWILNADREINVLLGAIRKIKINERHLKIESHNQVFKILSIIESQNLASSIENKTIYPVSANMFMKYMNYVFLALQIPKEQFWGLESVRVIIQRWERSMYGFKHTIDPYVEGWKESWKLVTGHEVTRENLTLFLNTLEAWDPIESLMLTYPQRVEIAKEWVKVYMDTQLIKDENSVVRSPILQERTAKWCLKFLPESFAKTITPMLIGPMFTKHGYTTKKDQNGRWTRGIQFKDEPPILKEPEKIKKKKVTVETDKTEIDLGSI